jgi:hypothetical protein
MVNTLIFGYLYRVLIFSAVFCRFFGEKTPENERKREKMEKKICDSSETD